MATKLLEDDFTDDDVDVDDDVDGTGSAGDGNAEAAGDGVAEAGAGAGAGADEADEATGAAGLQLFCLLLIVRILNSRCVVVIVQYTIYRQGQSFFLSFFLPNCLVYFGR